MRNVVYFDLETQKGANEVGGWRNKGAMRMSLGVTYGTARQSYRIYAEPDIEELLRDLRSADLVVGFNIVGFDFPVLEAYTVFDLQDLPTLDLLRDVEARTGRRMSLENLARATLGLGKTAEGVQALRWWKEGKLFQIAEYCCYDVKITRLLHEHGARHGQIYYFNEQTQRKEVIPVCWNPS
ncbi:DEAD/DEAH box helicase domain-containing protein [Methylacidimicrobium sp. AP8]|uniref:ribonuclease H-like domain-containing protein n=1 Tax=Methylacidimicrobium sp. AP8 TaxID=2730359 RepID=UPI0018C09296|nr:ribonuclease H-like domain-containing protein [Methylacidimicrobium sp. AP8]CAB4244223.1 DEAD/DEAH box helicase domain-containing protein [Methylacidimicrobium sp. AP8]